MKKGLFVLLICCLFFTGSAIARAESAPLYRFWSDTMQSHFYTNSSGEKDYVVATYPDNIWRYEGQMGRVLGDGGLVNSDIASDAAISYSKLNLGGSILASDFASNSCSSGQLLKYSGTSWECGDDNNTGSSIGNTVESSEITDGTVVNADISPSAAIDADKIDFSGKNIDLGTSGSVIVGDSSGSDFMSVGYDSGGDRYSFEILDPSSSNGFYLNDNVHISGDVQVDQSLNLANTANGEGQLVFPGTRGGILDAPADPGVGVTLVDTVRVNDVLQLNPLSANPFTCRSEVEGTMYYNSSDHKAKVCNGTAWTDLY